MAVEIIFTGCLGSAGRYLLPWYISFVSWMLNGSCESSVGLRSWEVLVRVTPRRTTARTPSASITAGSKPVASKIAIGAAHKALTKRSHLPGDSSASVMHTGSAFGTALVWNTTLIAAASLVSDASTHSASLEVCFFASDVTISTQMPSGKGSSHRGDKASRKA